MKPPHDAASRDERGTAPASDALGSSMLATRKGRRPREDRASTATERARRFDAALRATGGRILSRVRLSAEANDALRILTGLQHSEREAIEFALLVAVQSVKGEGAKSATDTKTEI